MAVMKPDTFDVENKRVSNQLGLIKRAIGRGEMCFCCADDSGQVAFSINNSETVRLLSVVIKNGCDLTLSFCDVLNNSGQGQQWVCGA